MCFLPGTVRAVLLCFVLLDVCLGWLSRLVDVCLGCLVFMFAREEEKEEEEGLGGGIGSVRRFAEEAEKAHTAVCLRAAAS